MSTGIWTINGTSFTPPDEKQIDYNTQKAVNRTIFGSNAVDYIGAEKLYVKCKWNFMDVNTWNFLKGHYDDQRLHGTIKALAVSGAPINLNVIIAIMDYQLPLNNNYQYASVAIDFIQL